MSEFEKAVREGALVLTDGGIETRIMFETDIPLPPYVQVAALVTDPRGAPVLRRIYESYVEAARSYGLPVIIGTPTFRASLNFVRRAELGDAEVVRRLNTEAVAMHKEIRDDSNYGPVYIAGVIGPSGDAYLPEESLPAQQAREYHGLQATVLARSGVDFLYARPSPRSRRPSARLWRWATLPSRTWSASYSNGTGGCSTARHCTRPSSG